MPTLSEQKTACQWMIDHYQECANRCWDTFDNLTDFYLIYDYYLSKVEEYTQLLNDLNSKS